MSKFSVGDTVIGNEKASGRYSITGKGWKGTVTEITGVNHFEAVHFDLEDEYFDLFKSSCTSKIIITSDGTTTLARLYDGDKVIKKAEAKCAPDDTFDFAVGAELAFQRLMKPVKPSKYEGMSDDELSNAICFYRRCDNWGSTGKNCPSRTYCHDGKGSYAYILEHRSEAIAYLIAEDEAKAKQDKPSKPDKPAEKHQYKVGDRITANSNIGGSYKGPGTIVEVDESDSCCTYRVAFDVNPGVHVWAYTDSVKPIGPAQPEPAKAEPVKLYCIKDYAPGAWTTKGKIYEKQADGRIRFDDGYCAEPMPFGSAAKSLVPLVKRPAKVGEWVYITSDDGCAPGIKIGNIYQVKATAIRAGWVRVLSESFGAVRNDEYLVLDGYQPEPKQPEPKPQYWSGKVVCIKGGEHHTLGAVYEIKDGIINHNTGDDYNMGNPVRSVEQLNDKSVPQFAKFKGECSK